jgi:subtilisin family serine protease
MGCSNINKESINPSTADELDHWHLKDYNKDSVPGISLDKLYDEILKDRKGKQVIVAIIDTEIDIHHEELKDFIWVNTEEIADNGMDDDNNGYVDDVNGWNFIGNNEGENLICSNYSFIRKLKEFAPLYEGKTRDQIGNDTLNFQVYQRALKDYQEMKAQIQADKDYVNFLNDGYPKSKKLLDSIFKGTTYTVEQLDSLYNAYEPKDSILAADVYFMYDFMRYEMYGYADNLANETKKMEDFSNNINYDDRKIIGDDVNNIEDRVYGTNKIANNLKEFTHGTIVTGVLAAHRTNAKGIRGITNNVKIMPLCIQAKFGSETDKDLALSIRYAIDNGAQIINLSSNRFYESHNTWVQEALLYAEKNNVLVIKAAGNNETDIDEVVGYPNKKGKNYYTLNNFIIVGASGKYVDQYFKPIWSNYGYETVDLYAPGEEIPTTTPFHTYKNDSGSSMSTAITSGVAALILSYYPDLKVNDVRLILMESATRYDTPIALEYDSDKRIPFSKLSLSGGVLNAYDAFVLAEKINKKRNEKSIP